MPAWRPACVRVALDCSVTESSPRLWSATDAVPSPAPAKSSSGKSVDRRDEWIIVKLLDAVRSAVYDLRQRMGFDRDALLVPPKVRSRGGRRVFDIATSSGESQSAGPEAAIRARWSARFGRWPSAGRRHSPEGAPRRPALMTAKFAAAGCGWSTVVLNTERMRRVRTILGGGYAHASIPHERDVCGPEDAHLEPAPRSSCRRSPDPGGTMRSG